MKRVWILTVILLAALAVTAFGQTPTLATLKVEVLNGTTVVSTKNIPWSSVTCNLAPTGAPVLPVVNPSAIEFDDPTTAGRTCRVVDTSFFNALTAGNYTGRATFVYSDGGEGGPATSNPFIRFLYAVLTGLKFVR